MQVAKYTKQIKTTTEKESNKVLITKTIVLPNIPPTTKSNRTIVLLTHKLQTYAFSPTPRT